MIDRVAASLTLKMVEVPVGFKWMALKALVERVYVLHSRIAIERHDWRCAGCRSCRRLQIHYRKYRSHGGTHRVENLGNWSLYERDNSRPAPLSKKRSVSIAPVIHPREPSVQARPKIP
jgi:hypothetical protein